MDSEDAAFRGDELRRCGISDRIVSRGVLKRGEDISEVECDACGDAHLESVFWIREPIRTESRAYIWCRHAGRVSIERERLQVWQIDFQKVATMIAQTLGFTKSPRTVVNSRVWLLGAGTFGGRFRDVFIVRGARWPDGPRLINDTVRLAHFACSLIFVPHLLPRESAWWTERRTLASISEIDWFSDHINNVSCRVSAILAEHDKTASAAENAFFRTDGGTWMLSFSGKSVHMRNIIGLGYVAELLRRPGVPIEAAILAGATVAESKPQVVRGIPLADEKAIKAVRADLIEKKRELAAITLGDWARRGVLEQDISKLETYIRQTTTSQGKPRKVWAII